MSIKKQIKNFWAERNKTLDLKDINTQSVCNLEENNELYNKKIRHEVEKVRNFTNGHYNKKSYILDIGCGIGFWSEFFSKDAAKIVGVDFSQECIDKAKLSADRKKIFNVEFIQSNVESFFYSKCFFDLVWMSGILIYLDDADLKLLLSNLQSMMKNGSIIILRDATSLHNERFIINDKFSDELNLNYSAIYRTSHEYIDIFKSYNFFCKANEDMFHDDELNKRKETRLRIYKFELIK